MSNLVEWHGLECRKCLRHIVLPHRIPQGRSTNPWYWPMGENLAWFLHPDCGYMSSYSESDVRLITIEPDQNPLPLPLWCVVIPCERDNCGSHISVHTRAESRGAAGAAVLDGIAGGSALQCPRGHTVPNPSGLSIHQIAERDEN